MRQLLSLIIIIVFTTFAQAQQESNNWYFGNNAALNFSTGSPLSVAGSLMTTLEGSASISDSSGNLLFYVGAPILGANSLTIWNKNNQPMPFCDVLNGGVSILGDASSSQAALAIPAPGNPNIYYLFTTGSKTNNNSGFWYYTIDITADGGLGDVIAGPVDISNGKSNQWSEKITAIKGATCNTIWVVSNIKNDFYAYEVSNTGVDVAGKVVSNLTGYPASDERRGYLKASPDGTKLVSAMMNNGLYMMDFDNSTGIVNNENALINISGKPYGIEFSRSSNVLYISTGDDVPGTENLYQFDLTQPDINSIDNSSYLVHSTSNLKGALQLGPDSKIYWAKDGKSNISVINNPEVLGAGSNYSHETVSLGWATSASGLPQFFPSLFIPIDIEDNDTSTVINNTNTIVCVGETKIWSPVAFVGSNITYEWIFDDLSGNVSTISNSQTLTLSNIQTTNTGLYTLKISIDDSCGNPALLQGHFNLTAINNPNIAQSSDWYYCDDNNDGFYSFDFDTSISSTILNGLSTLDYEIKYFTSQADADANLNAITVPYNNTAAYIPETIYARVHTIANPNGCYSTTSFTIAVTENPIPTVPADYTLCDDALSGSDTDGFTNGFLLSTKDTEILGGLNPAQFNISYHTTLLDAQNNTASINKNASHQNATINSQTIFVRIENVDNTSCSNTNVSFNLLVNTLPTVTNYTLNVCDVDTDGFVDFNLIVAQPNLSTNFASETFKYYPTFNDATNNTNAVLTPTLFTNRTVNSDKVWVRVISSDSCYRITELDLWVNTTTVPNSFMETFESCDDFLDSNGNNTINNNNNNDDTDGITTFDFSSVNSNLINLFPPGQQLTITYYTTQVDGLAGTNAIADISKHRNNSSPNSQTIYARIDSQIDPSCFGVYPVATLNVNTIPALTLVGDLQLSDDTTDDDPRNGIVQSFDLDSQTAGILGALDPADYTVSYHASASDAANGTNALSSPFTNTIKDVQPIYIRVVNNTTGCINDHNQFNVIVNPIPFSNPAANIGVCDDDSDGSAINGFSQSIILTNNDSAILGTQDPTEFSVTYHSSATDAANGSNPLTSPFSNTVAFSQTIYIRVTNLLTNTFIGTESFQVIVNTEPLVVAPSDLEICDDRLDGSAITGFSQNIDLSTQTTAILNGLNPADYTISYHTSVTDAENGLNSISSPFSNTTAFNQTIFIRATNNSTGCINARLSFEVIVHPEPTPTVVGDLFLSDNNNDGDPRNGIVQSFDLDSQTAGILGGLSPLSYTVSYHASQADATTGSNSLTSPFSNMVANTQAIYVRLVNNTTGCINDRLTFNVVVNPIPFSNPASNIEVCDDDSDGSATNGFSQSIVLTNNDSDILGAQNPATFSVSYHSSASDASAGVNSLSSPFSNTVKNIQTIYIRVTNIVTNTFVDTESFQVIVNTEPLVVAPSDLEICDDRLDGSAITGFSQNIDLSTQTTAVLNGLNPAEYTISYHTSVTDADNGLNAISSSFSNTTAFNQTIFIRAVNNTTLCVNSRLSFDVIVHPEPTPTVVGDLFLSDNNNDGDPRNGIVQSFDLDSQTAGILGGLSPLSYTVSYHASQADATTGSNSLTSLFSNTMANTQAIYVRLVNNTTGCINDRLTFNVVVNPIPFSNPAYKIEVCDDDSDGSATNGFSQSIILTNNDSDILGTQNPATFSVSYHLSAAEATAGVNSLTSPFTNTIKDIQTIYIRVTNIVTSTFVDTESFQVIVNTEPLVVAPSDLEICDDRLDGSATTGFSQNIDLTTQDTAVLNGLNPASYTITYHVSASDADNGLNAISSSFSNTTAFNQTIFIRAVNNVTTSCINARLSFDVIVHPEPTPTIVGDIFLSDNNNDGDSRNGIVQSFDLESQTATILGGLSPADYTVSYHASAADASNGANALSSPFSNTVANSQTIYVRLVNNTTGCINDRLTFNVVVNPIPFSNPARNIEVCDDDSDGSATNGFSQSIILTNNDTAIIGTQDPTEFSVTYHANQTDASLGNNPLTSPFSNTVKDIQTIYIRVINLVTNTFIDTESFQVIVNTEPLIIAPSDLEICDDRLDGSATTGFSQNIDLSTQTTAVLNGLNPADYSISYHTSVTDAENGLNSISSPFSNTIAFNQTIFIRAVNNATSCINSRLSFEVIVHPEPTPTIVGDIFLSDNNNDGDPRNGIVQSFDLDSQTTGILGGLSPLNYTVSYHTSLVDATNGSNALSSPFTNTVKDVQTIYVRLVNNTTGCINEHLTFNVIVNPIPLSNPASNIEVCDDDSDGSAINGFSQSIILTNNDTAILGTQNPTEFSVTYHSSSTDATNGTNPLTSPFSNTVKDIQTIYIRVTNIVTNTFVDTESFQVIVNTEPLVVAPSDLEICDDLSDGSATTGFSQNIDLTTQNTAILNGLNPADYTITYHTSVADADNGVSAISSPFSNTTAFNQTIFIRAVNNTTLCVNSRLSFEVIIHPEPTPTVVGDLFLSDNNNDGDPRNGIVQSFDLDSQTAGILGGLSPADYTVSYHASASDATTGTNALSSPFSNTVANSQTIYVRLVNNTTRCINDRLTFNVVVNPIPFSNPAYKIEVCDDDSDGSATNGFSQSIMLTNNDSVILGTQDPLEFSVTYHSSQTDAANGSNILSSPFTNTVKDIQTIYIRVTNIVTNTFIDTESFQVIVNTEPLVVAPSDLEICDDRSDGSATTGFSQNIDLSTQTTAVLNGLNPADYSISYHTSVTDAENGLNSISSPFSNTTAFNQTIFIRAVNNATSCINSRLSFEVIVHPEPTPTVVGDIFLSDNNNDGDPRNGIVQSFDLDSQTAAILGGLSPADYTVSYHASAADATNGTNALTSLFTNTVKDVQTIYVRLVNNTTGCINEHLTFNVIVNPIPLSNPASNIEVCDDDSDGSAINGFSQSIILTNNDTAILGTQNPTEFSVTYHSSASDAANGTNPITSPFSNTVAFSQTIYIRVTNLGTNTFIDTESFQVIVNTEPLVVAPSDLEICDDRSDGSATTGFSQNIDLTTQTTAVLNGLNPADYTISYHTSVADAENGLNSISSPFSNTTAFNQTIFIRAVNNATSCINSRLSFEVIIHPEPTPTVVGDIFLSDNNNDGDPRNGIVQSFDLDSQTAGILGGLSPADYTVSYHTSAADATNGTNALTSLFTNTVKDVQTIYVRLVNNTTGCINEHLTFNVIVNSIPFSNPAVNIEVCDDDSDGSATNGFSQNIVLTNQDSVILGTQNPAAFSVTYHSSASDASSGNNPLTSPFTNTIKDVQTIYIRVTNTATNTFIDTESFDIIVNTEPLIIAPSDLEICDDRLDGSATTGFSQNIDLTTQTTVVLNGLNPAEYTISYHVSASDADNGNSPITNLFSNTTAFNQTIFIRAVNNATSCINTRLSFEVIVQPEPIAIQINNIVFCDLGEDGDTRDGITQNIDLSFYDSTILGGQSPSLFEIAYYTSLADATAENNPIIGLFSNTISHSQTIYTRVTNKTTMCYNTSVSFDIEVNYEPLISYLGELTVEDDDLDGSAYTGFSQTIDFGSNTEIILGNLDNSDFTITYHKTLLDAANGSNPLSSPYANTTAFQEIIYVRLVNNNTGCLNAGNSFKVNVNPKPIVNNIPDIEFCDDDLDGDDNNGIIQNIDLSSEIPYILGSSQSPTEYSVTFHKSQSDAENGLLPLVNFENTSNRQQIYVRVENLETHTTNTLASFYLSVKPLPILETISPTYICLNQGSTTLSVYNPKGIYTYEWTNENGDILGNTASVDVTSSGTYYVTAMSTDGNGCSKTNTVTVVDSDIAIIKSTAIYIIDDSDNNSVTINNENQALGIGDYEFSLVDLYGTIIRGFQDGPRFDNLEIGVYKLLVRDKNGCGISEREISLLDFPNFFTPNNDGENDKWAIKGLTDFFVEGKVDIFNRFGQIIDSATKDEEICWDGTKNGVKMPSTDYWYNVLLVDKYGAIRKKTGHFSLLRK